MKVINAIFIFLVFSVGEGILALFFILKHQFFRHFQFLILKFPIINAQDIQAVVHGIGGLSFLNEIDPAKGALPQAAYNLKVSDILFGCFINFQLFCRLQQHLAAMGGQRYFRHPPPQVRLLVGPAHLFQLLAHLANCIRWAIP